MTSVLSIIKNTWLPDYRAIIDDKKDKSFPFFGTHLFYGYQGQGKTIAMVKALKDFKSKYPNVLIISNLDTPYTDKKFESFDELFYHLRKTRNENKENGTVFAIDEIQYYFNSHDSKSIPMWVFQVFSQQRKANTIILGTVQVWEEVTKTIRSQIISLVEAKKLGYLHLLISRDPRQAINEYGEVKIPSNGFRFFWNSRDLRASYDTSKIIDSGREQVGSSSDFTVRLSASDERAPRLKVRAR